MTKDILEIVYTKGGRGTQPGGVVLRKFESGEYVTHRFNRTAHDRLPREFYWGHYFHGENAEERALKDFQCRVRDLQDPTVEEHFIISHGDPGFDAGGN